MVEKPDESKRRSPRAISGPRRLRALDLAWLTAALGVGVGSALGVGVGSGLGVGVESALGMGTGSAPEIAHAAAPAEGPAQQAPETLPAALRDTVPALRIVPDETVFAVVTRRAGPAARFAHDHMVYPARYDAELTFDPHRPGAASLELAFDVEDLVVDDQAWQQRIEGRLEELEILDEPFQPTTESERADIREAMLDEGQLHAEAHPRIHFRTRSVQEDPDDPEGHLVAFEMTVRDETREGAARVRLSELETGRLLVEGHARLHFTDFGIEPYRAFLGAVRNEDRFFLYLHMVVAPEGA